MFEEGILLTTTWESNGYTNEPQGYTGKRMALLFTLCKCELASHVLYTTLFSKTTY